MKNSPELLVLALGRWLNAAAGIAAFATGAAITFVFGVSWITMIICVAIDWVLWKWLDP